MNGNTLSPLDLQSFESKIDVSGDCYLWTGCRNSEGYGMFRGKRAHRIALERKLGRPIHVGHLACHTCIRHRHCVNPAHLYEGTPKSNMEDRTRDGTFQPKGRPRNKITPAQVIAIRSDTRGSYAIAQEYGLDSSYVRALRRGKFHPTSHPPGTDTPGSSSLSGASPLTASEVPTEPASHDS